MWPFLICSTKGIWAKMVTRNLTVISACGTLRDPIGPYCQAIGSFGTPLFENKFPPWLWQSAAGTFFS